MQTTQNKKFHNQSHREVRTQPSLFCYAIFYSSFIIPYIFRFENFPIKQKKWLVHTNHFLYKYIPSKLHIRNFLTSYLSTLLGYALDLLVTVSSMCYHTSTSVLSTSSSSRGLTTFVGISHLEGGFTLRCLQRLSRPGLATLLCSWRNNRSTSGQSIPVLSY